MRRLRLALRGTSVGALLGAMAVAGHARADGTYASPPRRAQADEASVSIGPDDRWEAPQDLERRYADPPPRPVLQEDPPSAPEPEIYRSPVRFGVGPAGFVAGHAQGFGLGITTDFGTGVVGVRLAATWMAPGGLVSLDQYTGELVLDALPHGPVHPVLGVGFGLGHLDLQGVGGDFGVGVGRLGLEYSLALRDADLRIGASVTGGLPGPREANVPSAFGPYAVFGGTLALGF